MRGLITTLLAVCSWVAGAQEVLSHRDFLLLVAENHPVARQATLVSERGDWEVTGGRGFLDPKLVSTYETKDFKEKDYYNLWNSYLSIPTPFNFELKTGYELNSGRYLNDQNTVPSDGLYYAGISVPVGRGLFLSERVFERNAGILEGKQLKIESDLILNNLLLDASYAYWGWRQAIMKTTVYRNASNNAQETFEGVRESFINGDRAAMDTTESLIQVQLLRNALGKAELDSVNQLLNMNNFLWVTTLGLVNPDSVNSIDLQPLESYETFALTNHPDLRALSTRQDQLLNQKRYYAEQVKPQLDVNYNFLLENGSGQEFNTQDFKAGVTFSVPLLLRKERSKLQITKLKQNETELKANQKEQEVLNKVRASYNKVLTTADLLDRQRDMTENYRRLLEGERQKFRNGESSIFYVNVRQNKLLESEVKLIEMEVQYQLYLSNLMWASGMIQNLIN